MTDECTFDTDARMNGADELDVSTKEILRAQEKLRSEMEKLEKLKENTIRQQAQRKRRSGGKEKSPPGKGKGRGEFENEALPNKDKEEREAFAKYRQAKRVMAESKSKKQ